MDRNNVHPSMAANDKRIQMTFQVRIKIQDGFRSTHVANNLPTTHSWHLIEQNFHISPEDFNSTNGFKLLDLNHESNSYQNPGHSAKNNLFLKIYIYLHHELIKKGRGIGIQFKNLAVIFKSNNLFL